MYSGHECCAVVTDFNIVTIKKKMEYLLPEAKMKKKTEPSS